MSLQQKLRALDVIMVIYAIIFAVRAAFWFHNRNMAIPAYLDTPVDVFVIGIAYIIKRHLIRSQNQSIGSQANPRPARTPADYAAIAIAIAIIGFIVLGVIAFIIFGIFSSPH